MLNIFCKNCDYNNKLFSSRQHKNRLLYVMRACGQGHSSIEKLTSLLNMSKPMTEKKLKSTPTAGVINKATGWQAKQYQLGSGLPLKIVKELNLIYNDLSSDSLLTKCLHVKTQNHNESLNGMVWNWILKTHLSYPHLEFWDIWCHCKFQHWF